VTATPALVIRDLVKIFPGPPARTVLAGLNLTLARGEYVAVMGESGIGKSTLLNLIAGLDRSNSGTVTLAGTELTQLDDDRLTVLRRRQLGFVFQAFHVLPYLTVAENVALPLALNRLPDQGEVAAMLAAVGLGDRGTSRPRELSGGELQRVAIARALVHSPSLVLADEPTGNLDPDTAAQVLALLVARLRAVAAAGILVTHSYTAAATAERVYVMTKSGLVPA
jgi:putative ABC transport system ATP-binding protein